MAIVDENYLQPWVIISYLLCLNLGRNNWLKLLAGIYFWSGFHKINPHFPLYWQDEYPQLSSTLLWSIGPIEAVMALCLCSKKFLLQKFALLFFLMMHLLIIATALMRQWNVVIIPWNIVMILLLLLILFTAKSKQNYFLKKIQTIIILFITIILPLLHLCTGRAIYFGWELYTELKPVHMVTTSSSSPLFKDNKILESSDQENSVIYLNDLCINTYNIPCYDFTTIKLNLCRKDKTIHFTISAPMRWKNDFTRSEENCLDLI
jgi:hypothetical protein